MLRLPTTHTYTHSGQHVSWFRWATALMLTLGLSTAVLTGQAQDPGPATGGDPTPRTFNCYTPTAGAKPTPPPPPPGFTPSSTNGVAFTPKGDLKVLVIFVGFTDDINQSNPPCNDYNASEWPQVAPNAPAGTSPGFTIPTNFASTCYTSNTQFSLTATDQSLSNFFYQMSRTTPSPLRMTFGTLPGRVNVTANGRGDNLGAYMQEALTAAAAAYPTFNWGAYDNRANAPGYAYDNSSSTPDGKLDYVVFCFRTSGYCASQLPPETGLASAYGSIPGTSYAVTTGHCQTGLELRRDVFLHEMAHTLYNSPHEFGTNGTVGTHFYQTYGWGMMQNIPTSFSANAWERWYLGWTELRTGPSQAASDIQNAASLQATGGQYVLRDYTTTGDVIRVRIPNTSQYLWLENRAKQGPCDTRPGWINGGDGQPLLPAPAGLLAMVEEMAGERSTFINPLSKPKTNALRVVSAEGNFDYIPTGPPHYFNQHFWNNTSYNYTGPGGNSTLPEPNATGGHSEITRIRGDRNQDNQIDYDDYHGNHDRIRGNESNSLIVVNDVFTDGALGPHIGTKQVGFRYGLDTNPMLIPHQTYNEQQQRLSTIPLNGLDIQITSVDPNTGALTLQIRFDNTAITKDTRWTGTLKTYPVDNASSNYEILVDQGAVLTLDRSRTPMRSTRSPQNDFVNDTELRVSTGTRMAVNNGSVLRMQGVGTTLYLEDDAQLNLDGGQVELTDGTTISVLHFSDISDLGAVQMLGGRIIERSTGAVQQRGTTPVAYPNPGVGSVILGWARRDLAPANAAAYRYELQDLRGHTLRQGACAADKVKLANVPAGLYLLVTVTPEGKRQTQRMEVQ